MKNNKLASYKNGNTTVSIFDDGTKIREYTGYPKPIYPESMDVKITNYCNGNCEYCHEKSNIKGQHANLDKLLEVLKDLPSGVEIAIGGGNPLTHPKLEWFLIQLKERGLIANMTINQKHIHNNMITIKKLLSNSLIKGLGISYSDKQYLPLIKELIHVSSNIVIHVIMGINPITILDELKILSDKPKVLVLGYKNYGMGKDYLLRNNKDIEINKTKWIQFIAKYFASNILAFDNLAIEQLRLKRFFPSETWEKLYMGEEGQYTCYIDAVNEQYAKCSVESNRNSFDEMNLLTFFKQLK